MVAVSDRLNGPHGVDQPAALEFARPAEVGG
jgi:hypothetical protein